MHIVIAGNIGAGKTTLATILHKYFETSKVYYEDLTDNPYISDFYSNMNRWGFHLQVVFLSNRIQQVSDIQQERLTADHNTLFIQDRSIYEDYYIFAKNLHDLKLMSDRDYGAYQKLFSNLIRVLPPADLTIYLKSDVEQLSQNIKKRGRHFEENITDDYLIMLNKKYNEWAQKEQHKIFTVDTKHWSLDDPTFTNQIIQKIESIKQRKQNG